MPRSTPPSPPAAASAVASGPRPHPETPSLAGSPPAAALPADQVYVDGIEGEIARLLIVDARGEWQPFHLPLRVLPPGLKENTWLVLHSRSQPPPPWADSVRSLRARLGRDDDGGDFSL